MLKVQADHIGSLAMIECEGRIVNSDAAFRLRDAVLCEGDASIIVLDLTEVTALEGGGLGMLVFLQRWAHDRDIRMKLFNPRQSVLWRLERASTLYEFEFASLAEMTEILGRAEAESSFVPLAA